MSNFAEMRKMSSKEIVKSIEVISKGMSASVNDRLAELQRRRDNRNFWMMFVLTVVIAALTIVLVIDIFK